jgi:hypothetical protein
MAGAALAALAPSSGAALAAHSGPALSHAAAGQALTWAIVPSANRGGIANGLNAVSCMSASSCVAVGSSSRGAGALAYRTLVESWNGSAWSVVPSPSRFAVNSLNGVSCTSASACTAVGLTYRRTAEPKTLIESWNGSAWSIVRSPNPAPRSRFGIDSLFGVSCISASACTAVGSYQRDSRKPRTLIESWNGSAWSVVPSPSPGGRHRVQEYLQAVSCTSATACIAVGGYQTRHAVKTLVESWNGTTWSVMPSPNKGSIVTALYGVSCTAADACAAIGHYSNSVTGLQSMAESWNGSTWSIVPLPNEPGEQLSLLTSISCTAADDCVAVGGYGGTLVRPGGSTLAESWDGSTWSIVPTPNVAGAKTTDGLSGVACASAALCMAVGSSTGPHKVKTLTELGTSSG